MGYDEKVPRRRQTAQWNWPALRAEDSLSHLLLTRKCSSCLGRRRLTHHTSYAEQLTFTLKAVKDIKPLNEASISTFNKKCLHLRGSSSSSSLQHLFQLMKFPARCFPLSAPKGSFSFEILYRAEGETRQIISRTRRHQATVETGYDRKMKEKKINICLFAFRTNYIVMSHRDRNSFRLLLCTRTSSILILPTWLERHPPSRAGLL